MKNQKHDKTGSKQTASVLEGGRDPGANDACPTVSLPQSQGSNDKDEIVGRLARVQMMLAPQNQPLDR